MAGPPGIPAPAIYLKRMGDGTYDTAFCPPFTPG
jgi:hypothetical protein